MEPNLVVTLLQTAIIAEQNGGKNVGKANCGNDELVFPARAIKEGRRVEEGGFRSG